MIWPSSYSSELSVPSWKIPIPMDFSSSFASSKVLPFRSIISIWSVVSSTTCESSSAGTCAFFAPPMTPARFRIRYKMIKMMITPVTIPRMVTAFSIFGLKKPPSSSSSSSSSWGGAVCMLPDSATTSFGMEWFFMFCRSCLPITVVFAWLTAFSITTKSSFGDISACLRSFNRSAIAGYLLSWFFCVHFNMIFSRLTGRSLV